MEALIKRLDKTYSVVQNKQKFEGKKGYRNGTFY